MAEAKKGWEGSCGFENDYATIHRRGIDDEIFGNLIRALDELESRVAKIPRNHIGNALTKSEVILLSMGRRLFQFYGLLPARESGNFGFSPGSEAVTFPK